jgi:hypothetical protein
MLARHRTGDSADATRRAVTNALAQPGGLFPDNVRVRLDGEAVENDTLDLAMTWVMLERQAAKRAGRDFDAIASLTRAILRARQYQAEQEELFREKGAAPALLGSSTNSYWHLRSISPPRPMAAPLELSSDGA